MPATATGPKTADGKAASSRNALQHGLTAKQIVLPGEDPAEYDALRQTLIDAHHPAEGLESILVDQIAQCVWRLNRARRIERDTLELELTSSDAETSPRMDKMIRYMAAIEREFHRSVRELTNLQSTRIRNQEAEATTRSQREIAQLQQEIHDRVMGSIPSDPLPLTDEDVARILAETPDIQNYETNLTQPTRPPETDNRQLTTDN